MAALSGAAASLPLFAAPRRNAGSGAADKSKFWTGDDYNTAEHKNRVYHHPKVITLDAPPVFLKAPQ
ncbi:hypothetical protein [Massilia sp. BSC265]|uniref:hypothetical protein n=1 Tax=Massilia sp. BSC265 TaxID=1549812 RepID=UPI00055D5F55|nr:hypothetical protein [Massilia sp. BSC265]